MTAWPRTDRAGWRLAALPALGVAAGLGQAPWGLWWLTPLALGLAMAMVVWARRPALAGWLLGVGYFGWTLQWIVEPFLVDPEMYGALAPLGIVGTAGGFALFWALAAWVARRWGGGGMGAVVALAGALGLVEAARSLILTGFPWALLGHVWIDTPLAQLAAWGGPHGLTLLTLLLALPVALWAASRGAVCPPSGPDGAGLPPRGIWSKIGAGSAPGLAVLLLLEAGLLAGAWWALDPGPAGPAPEGAPLVRIVQPNVPQAEKWDPARVDAQFADLLRLSEGPPASLTVWPETSLPWALDLGVTPRMPPLGRAAGTGALATGLVRTAEGDYWNSLAVFDADGSVAAIYDKWHLVPFGEYLPFGDLLARFGLRGLAQMLPGGFSVGPGPDVVEIPGLGPATALICYEGIFAEEVNAAPGRPRLLILITNDAWFGTRAGPQQHLAQARLRSIEQGVPMVRAANTGISALIDARGRVLESLPLGTQGAMAAPLPEARGATPYTRLGDGPALALLLALALVGGLAGRRRVSH
ncbi:apolipoprotein N-acyltransferase [Wenxinia marina]|uniref:Apolipoprotein N-acyltransferase n=1 Tax=Wenxinia marina DSM 24838 TaxID=1123501 RepID=A0A0D0P7J3_9RHOB|nr:apolipoprotein N-acyltransferase [Wenxinia marina]KIQ67561.1 apolipoprotein N-acyltransferase [Wenxinia marina DSM 24838]GGL68457.1 apolipoprotein N-acyltransferase [Wenxinia marina]